MPDVADYVAKRLEQLGVKVLFGVPAYYCYRLFKAAPRFHIATVVNSSDLEAGYAADGYARIRGVGAVSVAYGVGTLSLANAIAGAYAERSPVIVLNGGPTEAQIADLRNRGILYSHSIGREATDLKVFEQVTELAVRISNAGQVPALVDNAMVTAISKKRPVYIEIAQNLWERACPDPAGTLALMPTVAGIETTLAREILRLINAASKPALLLGVELQRYGLAAHVIGLIGKLPSKCVWTTTVLAKSVVPEDTPRFAGVCDRESGPAFTRLKQADQLIALGCVFSTGYRRLVTDSYDKMVHAANGKVRVGAGTPVDADIRALVSELNRLASSSPESASSGGKGRDEWPEHVETTTALTHEQLFREVEAVLDTSWVVVADTFLGIHAASDLKVKGRDAFLCNAVWASIGHSVAAAIGAALAAGRRPLVVCGDGGFQMTVQALSTMAHHRLNPVIVLVDNGLYGYEQYLIDRGYFDTATTQPEPYVTLNRWNYTAVAKALGFTSVFDVNTPATLRNALATAKNFAGPSLVAASVNPRDLPSQL